MCVELVGFLDFEIWKDRHEPSGLGVRCGCISVLNIVTSLTIIESTVDFCLRHSLLVCVVPNGGYGSGRSASL